MTRNGWAPAFPGRGGRLGVAALALAGILALAFLPSDGRAQDGECKFHPAHPASGGKSGQPRPDSGSSPESAQGSPGAGYPRSVVPVDVPDVDLTGADGARVSLPALLGDGKPVMLNFIFTTCGTICPLMSTVFSRVREELGQDRERLRMISISIDPEHDTPGVLREYARRFEAGKGWIFLTGSADDIITVEKAFGAYRGNKMNHQPYTFLRAAPESSWIRIEEIVSAEALTHEARMMIGER